MRHHEGGPLDHEPEERPVGSWRSERDSIPVFGRTHWGCETTEVVADHFSVEYQVANGR